VLAKQLGTLHHLSDGRLVVGVAAGGREDDFAATGVPFADRGSRLDEQIAGLHRTWADGGGIGRIGPRPPGGGPVLLVGGHSEAAVRRAARFGEGWIAGAGSPTPIAERLERVRTVWSAVGRCDPPRLFALAYVALGPGAHDRAEEYLRDYYAFLGPHAHERVLAGTLTDETQLRAAVRDHEAAGCHELILFPCVAEPDQVDLIARAVLPREARRT
jgi:alkanesulfonate monooxygenase SsuD/methylene tetrahydromethanopterin reductase-like flavin-dependent oxidoreductase (luciferase family)